VRVSRRSRRDAPRARPALSPERNSLSTAENAAAEYRLTGRRQGAGVRLKGVGIRGCRRRRQLREIQEIVVMTRPNAPNLSVINNAETISLTRPTLRIALTSNGRSN